MTALVNHVPLRLEERFVGFHPTPHKGQLSLDPSCGWSGRIIQTLCRCSRNIPRNRKKTASRQRINTPLSIFNSCTNEILYSEFFILNLSHPPRAGGIRRLPDAEHPGKTEKGREKACFLTGPFSCFHYACGGLDLLCVCISFPKIGTKKKGRPMAAPTVFVFHASRGNLFVSQVNYFAKMGAGAMLLPGGTGGKKPPAPFLR